MAVRPSFFAELKRRNALRAGLLYVGAVWALAQGISQLSGPFDLPNWVTRWFVIACAIGFPFWVAFAWFYEFTPQGFKRDEELPADAPRRHTNARLLDFAIIGVLIVAVVLLGAGYLVKREPAGTTNTIAATTATMAQAAAPFDPPKDTLVVLPFKNLSGSTQQYFSDGITEELTDALGQNPALRVIAWETAAHFRDNADTPSAIGRQLNVANILDGSIARAGDQVRITAELVNAVTGMQIWSNHYDESFSDIFKVQDQVSEAISGALQVKLAKTDLPMVGTSNPEAHDLVLKGRALANKFNIASFEAARKDFEAAIALDPNYADAHALLSRVLIQLTERSNLPLKATLPRIRAEAEQALKLAPRNADGWVALGNAYASSDPPNFEMARKEYEQALALDPSNVGAHLDYGNVLPLKRALAEEQKATRLDPDNTTALNNLATNYQDLGNWEQLVATAQTLIRLDPSGVDGAFYLAWAYQQLHRYDRMAHAFDQVKPATPVDQEQVDAGRQVYRAVADPALRPQALAALKALGKHQSNPDVAGNLIQMYASLNEHEALLQLLETECPSDPVACNDLAINPEYTALHGDPRFQELVKRYNTVTVQ
ncbi:MAG: hypothetical protein EPN36_13095 [Rhodanobacteraceae bacterium]|nr:MAG: hypothetical protein EPN36_13095 [Rhodanobacteraceae bacterium]